MSAPTDLVGGGPWNPGIQSQVPKEMLHLSTMFRAENVFTNVQSALDLQALTGLPLSELVTFRPQRLVLHELLIRVTADFAVPDGTRIEDLGINFRQIARLLLSRCVTPHMDMLIGAYAQTRDAARSAAETLLGEVMPGLAAPDAARAAGRGPGLLRRFTGGRAPAARAVGDRRWGPTEIAQFEQQAAATTDPLQAAVGRTLGRVMAALFTTHGEAWGTRELIVSLTTDLVANACGGEAIGRVLEPLLQAAAGREGCRLLPMQQRPVVINTKGASASGKSSLRPLQKQLAGDIGVEWRDFALISPDIWRKQLLDYASLGAAYKYAGAFTAEELQIVDRKLDRHMARKGRLGQIPHLLIDRFRFDSFAPDSDEAGSNLLTRFGDSVFLFFVITPPESLVERAWNRGLEFGRYKAVDDTLAHAVEAYEGIPAVLFTWVRRSDKRFRFEFLDNTVAFGERPRTVAFGDNSTCNILDIGNLLNIERFARIDVQAQSPQTLYAQPALLGALHNTGFLKRCAREFQQVNLLDQASGRLYLRLESGIAVWRDPLMLEAMRADEDTRVGLAALCDTMSCKGPQQHSVEPSPVATAIPTLGQWGSRDQSRKLQ